ncbi:MAG TPA: cofactor-independent phosphoglycerate mutase [Clostridiales bacterium]|nr:cofactor-independent phosphoglycerate mutase [Clostridiales bacterium]
MKYIMIVPDGMADDKVPQLNNRTPLDCADMPTVKELAMRGEIGLVKTIPDHMPPGSDVANLSVMGYDPEKYYTGRSSLEAVSIGIDLSEVDITFRCNLVTLSGEEDYAQKTMLHHSADEITTEEAKVLIHDLAKELQTEEIQFYPGVGFRHVVVWNNGPDDFELTPPHDILGRKIEEYLPKGPSKDVILNMMIQSNRILKDHPINQSRIERGLKPANSIWIWGLGKKPILDSFYEKYKLKGSVISAVDLIKGIGICAGMKSIDVEGATGNIHTNFEGKTAAALKELENGQDFVYVHIEAPDECGHQGDYINKVRSMEWIDSRVVKPIVEKLDAWGEPYKILILPDHPTPLSIRTHTADPVPFVLYDSTKEQMHPQYRFTEKAAQKSGIYFDAGYKLTDYFLK